MEQLLAIVFLVFGILQIILFFKIWGMTNNVKDISDKFNCSHNYDVNDKAQKAYLQGNAKEAYEIIINDYVDEILKIKDGFYYHFSSIKEAKDFYSIKLKKLNMDFPEQLKNINDVSDIIEFRNINTSKENENKAKDS